MLTKEQKEKEGKFCRDLVENAFYTFEGARGTCARIRGEVETIKTKRKETTYGWEGEEEVVLPQEGEIPFDYVMDSATRYFCDEYVATPEGVFRTYSMDVVRK